MFNISFCFDEIVEKPDEYTMGYISIESDEGIVNSKDMSGRGLMMVFFSLTSLLESIVELKNIDSGNYRFVGEDSAFILIFEKSKNGNIIIMQGGKTFCTISFSDFVNGVWEVSELLFSKYERFFDNDNIAKKDWLRAREDVASIIG